MGETTLEFDDASPLAGALVESLRSFGYSPETAIADLVDNSISASARNISIDFIWAEENSFVRLHDDGQGITEKRLVEAMRPGSTSPTTARSGRDLGRFGLGLKTASFSQARELTVVSKAAGARIPSTRRWDLDYVVESGQWRLLRDLGPRVGTLDMPQLGSHGTTVFWTKCDHLVRDVEVNPRRAEDQFLATAARVSRHLGMTFHRFLSGRSPLRMTVNDQPVMPWDPVLRHPATQQLNGNNTEVFPYGGSTVRVTPYVLPHRSKLSLEEHQWGAGVRGWAAHQGFYVYRNDRLMVAGDWLGLKLTKDEHTKLARIVVDFDSSLDLAWQIDVRKSIARPPAALAGDFDRIAKYTRKAAEDVYRYRGGLITGRRTSIEAPIPAWIESKLRDNVYQLRVNRAHPVVQDALDGSTEQTKTVSRVIELLEQTIPTNLIGVRIAQALDDKPRPYESNPADVVRLLDDALKIILRTGCLQSEAIDALALVEPFVHYPAILMAAREKELSSDDL